MWMGFTVCSSFNSYMSGQYIWICLPLEERRKRSWHVFSEIAKHWWRSEEKQRQYLATYQRTALEMCIWDLVIKHLSLSLSPSLIPQRCHFLWGITAGLPALMLQWGSACPPLPHHAIGKAIVWATSAYLNSVHSSSLSLILFLISQMLLSCTNMYIKHYII